MKYCADTWFMLKLAERDEHAFSIVHELKSGKTQLIIPIVAYAETIKKLLQQGKTKSQISFFFNSLQAAQNITIAIADQKTATEAATVSYSFGVPLADSFVAATTKIYGCDRLLTKDGDYHRLIKNRYLKIQNW